MNTNKLLLGLAATLLLVVAVSFILILTGETPGKENLVLQAEASAGRSARVDGTSLPATSPAGRAIREDLSPEAAGETPVKTASSRPDADQPIAVTKEPAPKPLRGADDNDRSTPAEPPPATPSTSAAPMIAAAPPEITQPPVVRPPAVGPVVIELDPGVPVPTALLESESALPAPVAAAKAAIARDFQREVIETAGHPGTPRQAVNDTWSAATVRANARFRAIFGEEAANRWQIEAAKEALRSGNR